MTPGADEPLPVVPISKVGAARGPRWLIEGLWAEEGVGLVGGSPKTCKTWLSLDLALSVASGTPALGTFAVPSAGPVLLFAAEDAPAAVRQRLLGLALMRGLSLDELPLHLVLAASLRLDTARDQRRLARAVAELRPRLLVLDPFVRLHRVDENSALEVSGVLAYLRDLQRVHHVAILVVHHTRKAGVAQAQAGLGLRGSGDLHAWGDSNLYLRRHQGGLSLVVEQRNAAAMDPLTLELREDGEAPHLALLVAQDGADVGLHTRILAALPNGNGPVTQEALRDLLRVRGERLVQALRELEAEGRVRRERRGWRATGDMPGETESGSAGTQPDEG
jgi:hypothetical protein